MEKLFVVPSLAYARKGTYLCRGYRNELFHMSNCSFLAPTPNRNGNPDLDGKFRDDPKVGCFLLCVSITCCNDLCDNKWIHSWDKIATISLLHCVRALVHLLNFLLRYSEFSLASDVSFCDEQVASRHQKVAQNSSFEVTTKPSSTRKGQEKSLTVLLK